MNVLPTKPCPRKGSHRRLLALALLWVAGCASYEETKVAFDSLAGMDPQSLVEPKEASYSEKALMHGWVTETFAFGSDGVLSVYETVFGNERSDASVPAPDRFVRDSLATLVDLSGEDPERMAETAYRISYVLSKDPRPLSRAIATDLAGQLLLRLETESILPDAAGLQENQTQTYLTEARVFHERLKAGWPGIRPSGPMSEPLRRAYLDAMTGLVELSAATSKQERLRLQFLLELSRMEGQEREVQSRIEDLLASCLRSTLLHGIADGLADADAHIRETAIFQLWRLGGRGLLPWMLDRLERQQTDPMGRSIDPSADVRRRLMQCIWSMDLRSAEKRFGKSMSSLEFLHTTAIWDSESHLKFLATECLAHLLDRPNEIGSHWVRSWWEDYVTKAKKAPVDQD